MLPKLNTLAKKRDFDLLFKFGRWERTPLLSIKYLDLEKKTDFFPKKEDPNIFKKQLKLAISVGLKYSKKAVERNRMKRHLSEILREHVSSGSMKPGFYVLVVPEKKLSERSFANIREELKLLLIRSGLVSG